MKLGRLELGLSAVWPGLLVCIGLAAVILCTAVDYFKIGLHVGWGPRQSAFGVLGILIMGVGMFFVVSPSVCQRVTKDWCVWESRISTNPQYAWMAALLMALIVLIFFLIFFYKRYDYIDDPPVRDSARGDVAFLFSANIWRQALASLYKQFPSCPWYGISLYLSLALSLVVSLYLFLSNTSPRLYKLTCILAFLSIYVPFLMRASYNYSSSLPGSIAYIGLFDAWQAKRDRHVFRAFLWGLLLLLSFMFRRDGLKVGQTFIASPVLAFLALKVLAETVSVNGHTFKQWRSWICQFGMQIVRQLGGFTFYFVIFTVPMFTIQVFDEYQYNHKLSWEEQFQRTSNRSRAAYYGRQLLLPAILKTQTLLEANGWSSNDVLFAEYGMVLFDENKFAAERFWNIFDSTVGLSPEESRQGLNGVVYNLTHWGQDTEFKWYNRGWIYQNEHWEYWPYYVVMLAVTVFVVWRGKRWYDKLFGPIFLAWVYFVSIYMLNYIRLPRHVAVPPLVIFCLALCVCPELDFEHISVGWHRKVALTGILIASMIAMIGLAIFTWESNVEIAQKREKFYALYADLAARLGSDVFIFVRPPLYLDYFVDPLGDQGPPNQQSILNVSSAAYSPLFYKLIANYGLERGYQVLPWMVDNPKAFFVSSGQWLINRIQLFMLETYSIQVEAKPVYVYPDGLTIYRFVGRDVLVPHFYTTYNFLERLDEAEIVTQDSNYVNRDGFSIRKQFKKVLFQHPPSQVSFRVNVPFGGKLRFSPALSPDVWEVNTSTPSDGAQFEIHLEGENGKRESVFSKYINPRDVAAHRWWNDVEVNLSAWSSQTVTITFTTGSGPQGDNRYDWAGWGEPQLGQWTYYDLTRKFYLANTLQKRLDQTRVRRIKINSTYQDAIYQHPNNLLTFPVYIEPDSKLCFGIGLDPHTWTPDKGDGVQFEVLVFTDEDLSYEVLFSKYIDPKSNLIDRFWVEEQVDMAQFSGRHIKLALATWAGPQNNNAFDWAYWVAPRLVKANWIFRP